MSRRRTSIFLVLAACGGDHHPDRKPIDPSKIVRQVCTRTGVAPALAPAGDAPPPLVTFAVGGGLVTLDDGGFHAGPPDMKGAYTFALDGRALWVAGTGGVYRIEGGAATRMPLPGGDSPVVPVSMAIGPDHQPWAMTSDMVFHFDGTAWQSTPRDAIGKGYMTELAVDAKGQVWVVFDDGLHVRDASGAWSAVSLCASNGPTLMFRGIALGADGLYFTADGHVYRLTDKALVELSFTPYMESVDALAVGPKGASAVATHDGFYVIDPAAPSVRTMRWPEIGLRGAAQLAFDARGRVWIEGDNGVAIVDGAKVTTWPRATQAMLAQGLGAIAVQGAGPNKLPAPGPVLRGTVVGHVRVGGIDTAGVRIQLCPSPSMVFQGTPCEGQEPKLEVESDSDGVFTFTDVPLGVYDLAMDHNGWSITKESRVFGMKAGGSIDVGQFDWK
jgi:hypothetical protein